MKSRKLSFADLAVESFDTTPEGPPAKGTVFGYETQQADTCTCNYSGCARTCTDYTDCWGVCGDPSGALGCETNAGTCPHDYSCHAETCPGLHTCGGYPRAGDMTCGWDCPTSIEYGC